MGPVSTRDASSISPVCQECCYTYSDANLTIPQNKEQGLSSLVADQGFGFLWAIARDLKLMMIPDSHQLQL